MSRAINSATSTRNAASPKDQTLPSGVVVRSLTGNVPPPTVQTAPPLPRIHPISLNQAAQTGQIPVNGNGFTSNGTGPTAVTPTRTAKSTGSPRKRPHLDVDNDEEIEVLSTRVSLNDIVSRQRITKCVKSTKCTHRQPFDYDSFCKVNMIPELFFDRLELTESRYMYVPLEEPTDVEDKGKGNERKENEKEGSQEVVLKKFKVQFRSAKGPTNVGNLKLTKKRKNSKKVRCPVCNVGFLSSDLIHDDFMATVMDHIPNTVESIEVDDNGVVSAIEPKKPHQFAGEIVELSDGEEDDEDDNGLQIVTPGKRKKQKMVHLDDDEDQWSDFFDSESSGDEIFAVEGTADDPVVID